MSKTTENKKKTNIKKVAVVLFNLGGPDSLNSVKQFLFNLFNDENIITLPAIFRYFLAKLISRRREKIAQGIYLHTGGKSPILQATIDQKKALEAELNKNSEANFKVFVCMRHWHPMADEVIEDIKHYLPDEIILLPLYPQFSTTTTASSLKEFTKKWYKKCKNIEINTKIKTICCYPSDHKFIEALVGLIEKSLEQLDDYYLSNSIMLFSAHGLPEKIIKSGDPYQWQIEKTTAEVVKKLKSNQKFNHINYKISYQSRVGPLKWISPNTEDEIKIASMNKKSLIIVPISFVSEHVETLVELDIEYKKIADQYGVNYVRIPSLSTNDLFIQSLADNVRKFADLETGDYYLSSSDFNRICPGNYKKCPCDEL